MDIGQLAMADCRLAANDSDDLFRRFTVTMLGFKVAQWRSGKALDLQSVGRGFISHWDKAA